MDDGGELDLESLTPGIRKTVAWLNGHGFKTTDSGDGHTNIDAGMEDALPFPHVVIHVSPEALVSESNRLRDLVESHGIPVQPLGPGIDTPSIQANYDPAEPIGLIMLSGVDDASLFPLAS